MEDEIDCLFIHQIEEGKDYQETIIMPIGLTALADFLQRNNIKTKIIHTGIEKMIDKKFDIIEFIVKHKVKLVCIGLYWVYQSYNCIKLAKLIKRKVKNIKIVSGGFTASFFHREIIKNYDEVDFVIRGDAEIPILMLANHIIKGEGRCLHNIPNLSYKKKGKLNINNQTYVINQEILDNLLYSNFELIRNFELYKKLDYDKYSYLNERRSRKMSDLKLDKNIFYYNVGRGCAVNCSFCGGSNISQKIINNRPKVIFKSIDSVIDDLKNLKNYGIEEWRTSFDPLPNSDYYIKLFRRLRKEKIKLKIIFDCWSLPSKKFIDEFKLTFREDSVICVSPETGSEKIRRLNKGHYYTNKQLFEVLDYLKTKFIKVAVYGAVGLPYETKKDSIETLFLVNYLRNRYPKIKLFFGKLDFDPCSPMYLNPKKYKIKKNVNSFNDLCKPGLYLDQLYESNSLKKDIIESIISLIEIEINCRKKCSYPVLYLYKNPYSIKNVDLDKIKELCKKCNFYNKCYVSGKSVNID